ncbi:hypothetical protein [Phormidium sp. CCY1219]|uniref:hypothetical protein n=1 Tax=Phormidium sp. CCY1219 TaxID=2886104 RepID=UPI002D1EFB7E|nr:hypothetical protein [Phormidium sp. CCY1219]MEB3827655.1 hypothetical protein [Phormidium sp. CCY1219]
MVVNLPTLGIRVDNATQTETLWGIGDAIAAPACRKGNPRGWLDGNRDAIHGSRNKRYID